MSPSAPPPEPAPTPAATPRSGEVDDPPVQGQFEHANASRVADRLWVGGDLDGYDEELAGRQLRELVDAGLTHVLDVREEWSDEEQVSRQHPEVTYRWLGIPDLGQPVDAEWFDEVVGFAEKAYEDPDAVVLAHCHAGINRGPSAGFAILLAGGLEPIEALESIRRVRPIVVVAYAEDALRWAHARLDLESRFGRDLEDDLDRVAAWRRAQQRELGGALRLTRTDGPTADATADAAGSTPGSTPGSTIGSTIDRGPAI